MLFDGLNDYELIYLIGENNEVALNLMYKKYSKFIYKIIYEYKINRRFIDDYFQEGLIRLDAALRTYDPKYNKTFLKYFEVILKREFNHIGKKTRKYDIPVESIYICSALDEENVLYTPKVKIDLDEIKSILSSDEVIIFDEVFMNNVKANEVSRIYNIDIKKVYNTIQKIKKIVKSRAII